MVILMNSKNPPAAYRAMAARLATMTIAQRAAELERAIAAVRAAEGMAPATINKRYHAMFACEDALRGTGV